MRPGATVLTRMPTAARSRATGRVSPTMPPLDAEYAAWPTWPSNAATDAMLTMAPRVPSASDGCVLAIAAAAWRSMLNVPSRLTLITNSNADCDSGSLFLSTVRPARPTPAELTRARNGPSSLAAATTAAPSSSLATSQGTNRPPISSATALPSSSLRSAMTTRPPSGEICLAHAAPIPDAPPVTMADVPLNVILGMFPLSAEPYDVGPAKLFDLGRGVAEIRQHRRRLLSQARRG